MLQTHTNSHILHYKNIENIRMKVYKKVRGAVALHAKSGNRDDLDAPVIIAKDKTYYFMVLAADAEQEWITKYINQKLANKL